MPLWFAGWWEFSYQNSVTEKHQQKISCTWIEIVAIWQIRVLFQFFFGLFLYFNVGCGAENHLYIVKCIRAERVVAVCWVHCDFEIFRLQFLQNDKPHLYGLVYQNGNWCTAQCGKSKVFFYRRGDSKKNNR